MDLSLTSSDLDRYYPKLKSAAKKHFGGLGKAYAAAGFDYKKIRKKIVWNEYLVLKSLRTLIRTGKIKALLQFREEFPQLYSACRRHFKNWRGAFVAAGLDPRQIEKITMWTDELIIKTLKEKITQGQIKNLSQLRNNFSPLYNACREHFGSWEEAMKVAGIPQDRIKRGFCLWSKRVILQSLQEKFKEGKIESLTDLRTKFRKLLWACREYYGSWQKALKAAGIDYLEIKTRNWSRESIIRTLKKLVRQGKIKSLSQMRKEFRGLYNACLGFFQSWQKAFIKAGLKSKIKTFG